MKNFILYLVVCFINIPTAYTASPIFQDLLPPQVDTIVKEFGVNFSHTSVSPASVRGKNFGLEFGLVAGVTSADGIKQLSSSAEDPELLHAGILVALGLPKGFGVEVAFIPTIKSDVSYSVFSLAGNWTFSEMMKKSPMDMAVKVHLSSTDVSFNQEVSGVPVAVTFENSSLGVDFIASKKLFLLEPYVGIGFLLANGEISVSGDASIFDQNLISAKLVESDSSGFVFLAGAQLNLAILKLAAEYRSIMGISRTSMKVSLAF